MLKKKSGNLSKRYQSSYETKDSGGAKTGVMDWSKADGEIKFFKPVEGKNRINIIPYTIKSKNHPLVRKGDFEIGDSDYVMDVYVHRSIGPSETSVICLKSTYGKPCPICEQSALLIKQGKEKEGKDLRPKRRVFYNVEDLKEPGTVKIFEASHNLFEKELIDEARDDDEGGFVNFADPVDGKEIKFRASETSFNKTKYFEFKSFSFVDRDEPLSDDLLESAVSFDEIMRVPTYEEVEKILYGQDDDDDESDDDEPPKSKKSARKLSKDDDDEEEPPKGKKKPVDDDESDDDDDEPPKPKKPVDDDESDDDDEAEEEKPKPKKSAGKCPFGHAFGKDTDAFEECDDCDCWDKCMKAGTR